MKKVLEVVGRMDRAGQETFLMNVLRAHNPKVYEITFVVNTNHIGEYEDEIIQLGGKIWHNPYSPSFKHLYKYLNALKKFIKENGPFDVIHCHVFYFGGFILKVADDLGIPIRIMHSHSTTDGYKNTILRRIYRNIALSLIKRHSTHFVACGKDAYRGLFKIDCHAESDILNNAILPKTFDLSTEERLQKRFELGLTPKTIAIINVARFSEVKNHKRIIEIFYDFLKDKPNSTLLLVGDGELRMSVEEMAKKLDIISNIEFLGMRSDIPALLNAADVLIMPSFFEGLPVSLIEAQAAGIPCVVSSTITKEVDMGLNLVHFVDLEKQNDEWINVLMEASQSERPLFEKRMSYIKNKGYTIEATWEKLNKLYGK